MKTMAVMTLAANISLHWPPCEESEKMSLVLILVATN